MCAVLSKGKAFHWGREERSARLNPVGPTSNFCYPVDMLRARILRSLTLRAWDGTAQPGHTEFRFRKKSTIVLPEETTGMASPEIPHMKSQNFEYLRSRRAVQADLAAFAERYAHEDS